jgi:uncharacterized membrane protein YgaE (UPF0421/DUF939 family)
VRTAVRRAGRSAWRWSRTSGTQPRLLLAAKAALAAAIAWAIARHVPGVAADYPYYAPLGAVLAMQSTVFASVRSGVQTLIGIAIGVALAAVTMRLGDPGIVAVAVAVGVGVLIAGFRVLGEGASWAPTAAVLVLLVGGSHAGGYSAGYILQTAIGVGIGLAVNFAVFPPLHFWDAERRIAEVESVLADHLDALAADLRSGAVDPEGWDVRQNRLDRALADVRERVATAQQSIRANPRAALHGSRKRLTADGARFRALERAVWYVTDLTEIVARSGPVSDTLGRPDPAFAERLASAAERVAALTRGDAQETDADAAILALEEAVDAEDDRRHSGVVLTVAAAVALRGVVESERRVGADG